MAEQGPSVGRRLADFFAKPGAQIVVVPSALSLIGLALGDLWGHPGWAVAITVVLVAGFVVWEIWRQARERRSRLRLTGEEEHERMTDVGGIVLFMSSGDLKLPEWSTSSSHDREFGNTIVGFLAARTDVRVVALLETDEARANTDLMQAHLSGRDVHVVRRHIEGLEQLSAQQARPIESYAQTATNVIDEVRRRLDHLDGAGEDVLADFTGGTAYHSIALFEAARATGAKASYVATPRKDGQLDFDARRLHILAEPSEE